MWGEMQRQATILVDRARQSRVPVLIQVAGEDRAVSSRAALDLADAFEGESQAIEYEGAYHDLYRDPLAGDAARDLEEWIEGRLDRMGSAEGNVAV
jgi:alpha-beta hydrolase superfamily lysophospholipase